MWNYKTVLGLTADDNLNWSTHIQKVSTKIYRTLGFTCRLKNAPPYMFYKFSIILLFSHIPNVEV